MDPLTRGDPTSPLRWTCKSRAKLAAALTEQGWRVSSTTVGRLLHRLGYRLQSPRKRQEGATHPDRNAQFEHINRTADEHLSAGQPVISVDTKKKELVGNFKNGGREWQPKGTPPAVLVHDFPTDAEGKAIPYGVYDMARNEAWVSVGWDHDTPCRPSSPYLTVHDRSLPDSGRCSVVRMLSSGKLTMTPSSVGYASTRSSFSTVQASTARADVPSSPSHDGESPHSWILSLISCTAAWATFVISPFSASVHPLSKQVTRITRAAVSARSR